MDGLCDVSGVHVVVIRVGVLAIAALQANQEVLECRNTDLNKAIKTQQVTQLLA